MAQRAEREVAIAGLQEMLRRLNISVAACEQCDLSQRCGRAGGLAPAPTSASRAVISCFFRLLRVPRSRATRAACFMLSHSVVNMSAPALAEAAAVH